MSESYSRRNVVVVAAGLCLAISFTSAEAGRAVFTGANDAEPINAGFRRDSIVLHDGGFQIVNGDDPYRDFAEHSMRATGYSDTWPDFFPELDGDIHPEIVEAIGANDFKLELTLDPESTRLHPHTNRSGQRFGVYLQFDYGQVLGGAYLIVGFDGIGGVPHPGKPPFALVGQGYWTYYVDERDVTGTAETITLVRRGDVFQLYTASKGNSLRRRRRPARRRHRTPDVNGTLAVKPNVIKDIGPNRRLTAMAFWTESAAGTKFDAGAGRLRSLVIESDALPRDINPESDVPRHAAINGTGPQSSSSEARFADADTGTPVSYAHIALQRDGVTYVVITDAGGRYAADVHSGDYLLDVTRKGYESQVAEITVDEAMSFTTSPSRTQDPTTVSDRSGNSRRSRPRSTSPTTATRSTSTPASTPRRSRSSPTSRSGARTATAPESSARRTATSPSRRSWPSTTHPTGPTAWP